MKTKKIISLILAGLMVVSLVACSKNTESPEVEEPTGDEYEYVEVVKPDFKPSSTNINFTTENGNTFNGNMVVSPLNKADFNPNETLEALKNLEFLSDWGAIRYETVERAYERRQDDNTQLTPYERTESIIAEQIRDEIPTGNDIVIDYWNDTESCINYNSITVRFGTSDEYDGLTDVQKGEILNIVFGEEVGKFLFETEFDEDFNSSYCSSDSEDGTMNYSREIEDGYAIYSVGCSGNFEILEGYPSEEVWMEMPVALYDFMGIPENERDVRNLDTFAKTFLGKYFGEDARITSDVDFLYVWNTANGTNSNGDINSKDFMINTGIYLPDASEDETVGILIDDCYENGEHGMSVLISFDYKEKSEWTEEEKEEIRQTAMEITRDILGVEDIDKYFDGDEFYDMTINGREEWVHVSFTWEDYDEETEHAYLHIMTSTDMSRRY